MKAIAMIVVLLTLQVGMAMAEDKKPDPSKEKPEVSKQSLATVPAADLDKPAKLTLRTEAPDEIALKRVTLQGPVVALAKSDRPLQTFNPFVPSKTGVEAEDIKRDPFVGRPRGIVLFSVRF